MGERIEIMASSLKDAIQKASAELSSEEHQIKYRIIPEKTKFFGHKQKEIFIEAWLADGSENADLEKFLRTLIEEMKIGLEFTSEENNDFLRIIFTGQDYKLMLYQNGNLLNAVQYLLNRLFSEKINKKIYCECENFRKKKEKELSALAHRYAKQIQRSNKPVVLTGLNPFERRIVHLAINKYNNLESVSEGDDFLKMITIKKKENA